MMIVNSRSNQFSLEKLGVVGALAATYGVMFLVLYPHVSYGGAPFGAVTVITGGWLFGLRGGLVTSLFVSIENMLLLHSELGVNWSGTLAHANFPGLISLILIACAIGHMSNLSRKVKLYAQRLQYEAFHDSLTNLPNRALFYDRLEHAVARLSRATNSIAVLFLDLDGFKQINDRHGHVTGDQLLSAVGGRLRTQLRLADTIARLGGDEFVVLLEDLTDILAAEQAAVRLTRQLEQPFTIEGTQVSITASIGIAFCATGAINASDLLLNADRAMYQAKAAGKARWQIFDPNQTRKSQTTMEAIAAVGD
ncbi:MAG TPA: GGDEF domain-containing protein [Nitrolancea sp.]|nr:GGDEF domain-containing protein [Nitrolancea sp.]